MAFSCGMARAGDVREAVWQKFETQRAQLATAASFQTPGLYDPHVRHLITFPPNGEAVDLGLPQAGVDSAGRPRRPIMARINQGYIWVDLDGDGRPNPRESTQPGLDGYTLPYACTLYYEDGTSAPYQFSFKTIVENESYALVRATARSAEFQGLKIFLFDDDGNGKYNDSERDAIVIGDQPVTRLGKHILVRDVLYEIIVHAAGATFEIRPATPVPFGMIDIFKNHTFPQKAETLKIHTVIVTGPEGCFSFDETHRSARVPAGVYNLSFGLFERSKEIVYMTKGHKTTFLVEAEQVASPKWGGLVEAKGDVSSDGQEVTVKKPVFIGEGSEEYAPENFHVLPLRVTVQTVTVDSMRIERFIPFGNKNFDVLPNGDLTPLVFRRFRDKSDEYEVAYDYKSGILGSVLTKQRLSFVFKRKDDKDKKKTGSN